MSYDCEGQQWWADMQKADAAKSKPDSVKPSTATSAEKPAQATVTVGRGTGRATAATAAGGVGRGSGRASVAAKAADRPSLAAKSEM